MGKNDDFCEDGAYESKRLAALDRYKILDTPREAEFNEFAQLAAHICQTPIAVINLIDRDRQWFKAEVGLGVQEMPLKVSICRYAILQDFLVVPDLTLDDRFQGNPLVTGEPHLRFYAGAVLKSSEGMPLGTLCVLDYKPRNLTGSQSNAIRLLARQIMTTLELRYAGRQLEKKNREIEQAMREIKTLQGLLPICAGCKKIRDDQDVWVTVEHYVQERTEAVFTHGLCPECCQSYFPEQAKENKPEV